MKKILALVLASLILLSCTGCEESTSPEDAVPSGEMPSATPDWLYYTFHYSGPDPVMDTFMDWIRSDGSLEIYQLRYNEYAYNQPFLDWVRDREDILLPVMKHEDFDVDSVKLICDTHKYTIFYEKSEVSIEERQAFELTFTWLSPEERQQSPESLLANPNRNTYKGEGECPWGEYWYSNRELNEWGNVKPPCAQFLCGEYVICLSVYGLWRELPWNDEYFDYFDFELTPLR